MADGDWMINLLQGLVSPNLLTFLHDHVLSQSSPLQIFKRQAISLINATFDTMTPLIQPLLDRMTQMLYDSPDIVVLVFLLVMVVMIIQVLSWIRRLMVWATGLLFRMLFWAGVIAGIAVVIRRGPEKSLRDMVVVFSKIAGYAASLKDVWLSEYQRYDAQGNGGAGAAAAAGRRNVDGR